jgi:hypothetical protein
MKKQIEIEGEIHFDEDLDAEKFKRQFVKFLKKKGYKFIGEIADAKNSIFVRDNKIDNESLIL